MADYFNKLSPAELERLAHLSEECSEVIKCVNKIIRHGYGSYDPSNPEHLDNRNDLEREIADIYSVVGLMVLNGDIVAEKINSHVIAATLTKKNLYYHHQDQVSDLPDHNELIDKLLEPFKGANTSNIADLVKNLTKSLDDILKDENKK